MRKLKKAAAAIAALTLCISTFFTDASAAESSWEIENTLDVTECRQGGTLVLSVGLKGDKTAEPQKISSLSGVLEYDTSLFTVEKNDILPSEKEAAKECTFHPDDGTFAISYASAVTVKDASQLLQIKLHAAADAPAGKTTVCITHLEWNSSDNKKEEIEHHVPAYITIQAAEETTAAGDVNADGNVDLTDARLIMQHYNGEKTLNSSQLKTADVNGDGRASLTDVKLVMQYYNGEIDELG